MARLTKKEWVEIEELYKQGWTQRQLAVKFKVRPETISLHMTKIGIRGGESVDVVRQEMEAALHRKLKEFADKRASRQIDTKEKFHTLVNSVLGFFVKDLKKAQDDGLGLDKIAGTARSLKEAVMGLKLAREELYTILEIKEHMDINEAPDLFVMPLSPDDEAKLRASGAYMSEDEDSAGEIPMDDAEVEEMRLMEEAEQLLKAQDKPKT